MTSKPSVIVVGAGIVGSMIAYRLARAGYPLTVVEQAEPGAGVTGQSAGWVNWITRDPCDDEELYGQRRDAFARYDAINSDLGGLLIRHRPGALRWCREQGQTEAMIDAHAKAGSPVETVHGVRLRSLVPLLADPPPLAAYSPEDFVLDARKAALRLLDEATSRDTVVHTQSEVIRINAVGGKAVSVTVDDRTLEADAIVVASGSATNDLLADFGVGEIVKTSPAALIRLEASEVPNMPIFYGPDLEVHPRPPTSLTMADGVPKGSIDQTSVAVELGEQNLRQLRNAMPVLKDLRLISSSIGRRPFQAAGSPMVRSIDGVSNLWAAAAHPGVILAPLIAETVAEKIAEAV